MQLVISCAMIILGLVDKVQHSRKILFRIFQTVCFLERLRKLLFCGQFILYLI